MVNFNFYTGVNRKICIWSAIFSIKIRFLNLMIQFSITCILTLIYLNTMGLHRLQFILHSIPSKLRIHFFHISIYDSDIETKTTITINKKVLRTWILNWYILPCDLYISSSFIWNKQLTQPSTPPLLSTYLYPSFTLPIITILKTHHYHHKLQNHDNIHHSISIKIIFMIKPSFSTPRPRSLPQLLIYYILSHYYHYHNHLHQGILTILHYLNNTVQGKKHCYCFFNQIS